MTERRKSYYLRLALIKIERKYNIKTSFFELLDVNTFSIIYKIKLGDKIIKLNEKQFDTVAEALQIIKDAI